MSDSQKQFTLTLNCQVYKKTDVKPQFRRYQVPSASFFPTRKVKKGSDLSSFVGAAGNNSPRTAAINLVAGYDGNSIEFHEQPLIKVSESICKSEITRSKPETPKPRRPNPYEAKPKDQTPLR